jgi:hypothetical protein
MVFTPGSSTAYAWSGIPMSMKYPSVELYRTLQPSKPQWYDVWSPAFALEPADSYFITWLSREQSGFSSRLKTFSNEIIIEILSNDQMRLRAGVRADLEFDHCNTL